MSTPVPLIDRNLNRWQTILGIGIIVANFWGTSHFINPFYSHTYPFAWYGLILFLDGLLWWRWGESLIFKKPLKFFTLLFWSSVFWFFFEIWNLYLKNWYYAGVSSNPLWSHMEAYLDFATVLPGMFLVYRLLHHLGLPRSVKTSFVLSKKCRSIFFIAGIMMILLPAAFPDYFFPLVWGAFFFLLEPICAAKGAPSILREAEQGEWTTLFQLLAAGLICGMYWELCNFWSLAKWIYSVPFLPKGKLFEMPYVGFFGFPPFCVESFTLINAVFLLRNGKQRSFGLTQTDFKFRLPTSRYAVMILLGVILSEASYNLLNRYTVDSRCESVSQIIEDIAPVDGRNLHGARWHYPLHALKNWDQISDLISLQHREKVRDRLQLAALLQLGSLNARLLEKAGVYSVKELATQDPDWLFARLDSIDKKEKIRSSPLVKRRVEAWVWGARRISVFY